MTTKAWYFTAIAALAISILTTVIQGTYGPVRAALHITAIIGLLIATKKKAWRK